MSSGNMSTLLSIVISLIKHALSQQTPQTLVTIYFNVIEYGIFGEGSQISTNQKRENSAISLRIG